MPQALTGEIALLWRERDPYRGDLVLVGLEADDGSGTHTFEVAGEPARAMCAEGVREGARVRLRFRAETIEMVNAETGETSDEQVRVVVEVTAL